MARAETNFTAPETALARAETNLATPMTTSARAETTQKPGEMTSAPSLQASALSECVYILTAKHEIVVSGFATTISYHETMKSSHETNFSIIAGMMALTAPTLATKALSFSIKPTAPAYMAEVTEMV